MVTRCKQSGCDRNAVTIGLCPAHYQRRRNGGDMSKPVRLYSVYEGGSPEGKPCGIEGCERGAFCRGLCKLHYARHRKYGDPLHVSQRGSKPIERSLPNETSPTKLSRLLGVSRQRAHQLLNREAHNARAALRHAVRAGEIIKPAKCERCSKKTADLEAHHWDYREALDVRWLCPPCHAIVHPHAPGDRAKQQTATP